jgi:uroporphyrinogen-III synthase
MKHSAVLVIRHIDNFSALLREAGFEVINLELITTQANEDLTRLKENLSKLSEYDGLFFTSPVAAEIFVKERNGSNGFHGDVYALGQRARKVLEKAGLEVKNSDTVNTADEMLESVDTSVLAGKRFLFVCGEKSLRTIPEKLTGFATVDEIAVYSTIAAKVDGTFLKNLTGRISSGEIDRVCFFSPSAVERFDELFIDVKDLLKVAVIGTTTADIATRAGFNVDFISPRSDAEEFARGLIGHINSIE